MRYQNGAHYAPTMFIFLGDLTDDKFVARALSKHWQPHGQAGHHLRWTMELADDK